MGVEEKEKLYRNIESGKWVALPAWIGIMKFVNPFLIIGGIFYLGQKEQDYENRMFKNAEQREKIIQHTNDYNVHMPLSTKMEYFVPRTEIEYKLKIMDEKLDKLIEKEK